MNNFYINNKKFTCFFLFMLWCSCLGFLGCGSLSEMPAEKRVVVSYQSTGEVLGVAKTTLKRLCASGVLDKDDCVDARAAYNEAVGIYKVLGDVAELALDSGDDTAYQSMARRLMALLDIINKYIGES